jgi:8-oxo-dGTP diphosphatase
MPSKTQTVRVGVAVFIWKDGKFLVQRRLGAHGAGSWTVPGGNLEFNESLEACARREVQEETGLQITNIRFLTLTNDQFKAEGKHYLTVWMVSDWASGDPAIMEPTKCTAQQWCDFENLPEPLFEPCWSNLRLSEPTLFDS